MSLSVCICLLISLIERERVMRDEFRCPLVVCDNGSLLLVRASQEIVNEYLVSKSGIRTRTICLDLWFASYPPGERMGLRIQKDVIWMGYGPTELRLPYRDIDLFEGTLDNVLNKYQKKYPSSTKVLKDIGRSNEVPLRPVEIHDFAVPGVFLSSIKSCEYVPTSDSEGRLFVLFLECPIRGKYKGELIYAMWNLKTKWDAKSERWRVSHNDDPDEYFPAHSVEIANVYVRDDDYYFITQSRRLFAAPKPVKPNMERKMTRIWDDPKKPILGVIDNVEHDRQFVWATTRAAPYEEVCFELALKPTPQKVRREPSMFPNSTLHQRNLLETVTFVRSLCKSE